MEEKAPEVCYLADNLMKNVLQKGKNQLNLPSKSKPLILRCEDTLPVNEDEQTGEIVRNR